MLAWPQAVQGYGALRAVSLDMNQPLPTLPVSPRSKPEKSKPVAVARVSDFMQLADAFRLALAALEVATDALEQEMPEAARLRLICGLRKQILGLKGAL